MVISVDICAHRTEPLRALKLRGGEAGVGSGRFLGRVVLGPGRSRGWAGVGEGCRAGRGGAERRGGEGNFSVEVHLGPARWMFGGTSQVVRAAKNKRNCIEYSNHLPILLPRLNFLPRAPPRPRARLHRIRQAGAAQARPGNQAPRRPRAIHATRLGAQPRRPIVRALFAWAAPRQRSLVVGPMCSARGKGGDLGSWIAGKEVR